MELSVQIMKEQVVLVLTGLPYSIWREAGREISAYDAF